MRNLQGRGAATTIPRAARLRALPRRTIPTNIAGDRAAPRPLRASSSGRSQGAGIERGEPLRRLGLHRRHDPQPLRADAVDPRRRPRPARRHRPRATGSRRATRPATRSPTSPTSPTTDATTARREHPRGHGHLHGALLPEPARLPAPARRYRPRPRRPAAADPRQHDAGPLHLQHPALGGHRRRRRRRLRRRPARCGRRCTGTACSATTRRSTPRTSASSATENNVLTCATDFIGMSEDDVSPAAIPALQDLSKFPPLTDRLQQGFLNFIYLGRLLTQLRRLRRATRRSSSAATRCSTRATSSTTATARAGSPAAR